MKPPRKKIPVDLMIFDLDGTLTDSLADISASANYALKQIGLEPFPPERIREFVGDGIPQLLRSCISERAECTTELLNAAEAYYRPFYEEHCLDHLTLYPDVRETLDFFSYRIKAVISNKMEIYTEKILISLGLKRHFQAVIGGDTLPARKPDPLPVRHLLEQFSVDASRAVIIGDGHQDVLCGKSAGIRTCAVTYGFRQSPELESADFRIHSLYELTEIYE